MGYYEEYDWNDDDKTAMANYNSKGDMGKLVYLVSQIRRQALKLDLGKASEYIKDVEFTRFGSREYPASASEEIVFLDKKPKEKKVDEQTAEN